MFRTLITNEATENIDADKPIEVIENEFKKIHKLARENQILQKIKRNVKININARPRKFNVGDLVLLKNEKKEKTELTKKLSNLLLGPYEVISIISDTNTKILVSNRPVTVHNNKIKLHNN